MDIEKRMMKRILILLLLLFASPAYGVEQIKQGGTGNANRLTFLMVSSTDHISGQTGVTCTVTLSKAGGSFGAASGAVTEIGNGVYYVAANATDNGTAGALWLHATGTGCDPTDVKFEVVAVDPQDGVHYGLTSLPNTAVTTNASLLTSGTGTDQLSVSAGKVLLQATQTGVTIPTVTAVTNQLTAAQIATGVWQDSTSGDFTTASSIGKSLYTTGAVPGAAGGLFIAGTDAATTVSITGSLSGSVGSVSGAVGSISGITFPTNFASLGIGGTGHITNVDTLTTYTGNTPQTGDAYSVVNNVTYGNSANNSLISGIKTKTDFLPSATAGSAGGVFIAGTNSATTVNITGNLTGNLSGSVGSVSGAVGSISGVTFPTNFGALSLSAGGAVNHVVLADTITTYTGNTVQTGNSYAIVSNGTYGNSALQTILSTISTQADTIIKAVHSR